MNCKRCTWANDGLPFKSEVKRAGGTGSGRWRYLHPQRCVVCGALRFKRGDYTAQPALRL